MPYTYLSKGNPNILLTIEDLEFIQKGDGGTQGTSLQNFASKHNMQIFVARNSLKFMQSIEYKPSAYQTLTDDTTKNTHHDLDEYSSSFPSNPKKEDIAFMFMNGHVGLLYYDGKNKYFMDQGGVYEGKLDTEELLKGLKSKGYEHVEFKVPRDAITSHPNTRFCGHVAIGLAAKFIREERLPTNGKLEIKPHEEILKLEAEESDLALKQTKSLHSNEDVVRTYERKCSLFDIKVNESGKKKIESWNDENEARLPTPENPGNPENLRICVIM